MWPELESNQRHKDFQSSQVIAIPCLWLPQINQDSLSLQENFDYFHDLLEVEGERQQSSAIGNYGYITAKVHRCDGWGSSQKERGHLREEYF